MISKAQSAFIPWWLITNNFLIGFKIGHYMNRKRLGAKGMGSSKLTCPRRMIELNGRLSGLCFLIWVSLCLFWSLLWWQFILSPTPLHIVMVFFRKFLHNVDLDRVTLSRPICSLYALKVLQLLFTTMFDWVPSMDVSGLRLL